MKRQLLLFLCIAIFTVLSCTEFKELRATHIKKNNLLSQSKIGYPDVIGHFITSSAPWTQVNFNSPLNKPELKWTMKLDPGPRSNVIIDNENHILVPVCNSLDSQMRCFDSNEKIIWDADFKVFTPPNPVITLRDSVITYSEDYVSDRDNTDNRGFDFKFITSKSHRVICLWRIDSDGNILWRTDSVKFDTIYPRIWRISRDRIIMTVEDENSGRFNIYSIEDGKLLEEIIFPDWNDNDNFLSPIELPDGDWLGYQDMKYVRFDQKFKVKWEFKIQKIQDVPGIPREQPMLTPDGLILIPVYNKVYAIDLESGKTRWTHDDILQPVGITLDGNYLFSAVLKPDISVDELKRMSDVREVEHAVRRNPGILAVDSEGNDVWSIPGIELVFNNHLPPDTIVYKDGNILFQCPDKLVLVKPGGKAIWEFKLAELGYDENSLMSIGYILPLDNGILWSGNIQNYYTWEFVEVFQILG
jgi:outer membrane protein assembly factor BamB